MFKAVYVLFYALALAVLMPGQLFAQAPAAPYTGTDNPCNRTAQLTVYMISQVLRGSTAEEIKHVQGFAAGATETEAAKLFTADMKAKFPGSVPISTLVTALPATPVMKTSVRCWPTI